MVSTFVLCFQHLLLDVCWEYGIWAQESWGHGFTISGQFQSEEKYWKRELSYDTHNSPSCHDISDPPFVLEIPISTARKEIKKRTSVHYLYSRRWSRREGNNLSQWKKKGIDSCLEERAGLITDLGLMPPKWFVIRDQAGFDNHLCSL